MLNILMQKELSEQQTVKLEKKYDVKIYYTKDDEFPEKDILDKIEIYIGWRIANAIDIMPNLKWIHLYSAGVDRYVEMFKSMENPPRLTNNRGTYAVPLTEHSLAMLFGVIRKINRYAINQTESKWHYEGRVKEISSSTAGIVGFGDVGKYTAKMLKALGAKVLVQKLNKSEKPEYVDEIYYGDEGLNAMLPQCDFVLLSLPGTKATKHLLDRERMLKMKPGAVITNVGRGSAIDCDALADLIEQGHIGGAGLDVTDPEPLNPEHKLWGLENVIITPHMAGSSPNAGARTLNVFEDNLADYIAGKKMINEIDFDKGY